MAEIKLFRIDSRLIHGQIITKWLKVTQADKIVVVDEMLAADDFMKEVYVAAVPKGISVDIYDTDKAMEEWERNRFGDGKVLVLVRDVATCLRLHARGFSMDSVQIGELPNGPGRTPVYKAVSFSKQEVENLKVLYAKNVTTENLDSHDQRHGDQTDHKKKFFEIFIQPVKYSLHKRHTSVKFITEQ